MRLPLLFALLAFGTATSVRAQSFNFFPLSFDESCETLTFVISPPLQNPSSYEVIQSFDNAPDKELDIFPNGGGFNITEAGTRICINRKFTNKQVCNETSSGTIDRNSFEPVPSNGRIYNPYPGAIEGEIISNRCINAEDLTITVEIVRGNLYSTRPGDAGVDNSDLLVDYTIDDGGFRSNMDLSFRFTKPIFSGQYKSWLRGYFRVTVGIAGNALRDAASTVFLVTVPYRPYDRPTGGTGPFGPIVTAGCDDRFGCNETTDLAATALDKRDGDKGAAPGQTTALNAFPNPTADELTVTYATAPATLRLLDLTGRELFRASGGQLPYGRLRLDVGDYPSGTYVLEALTAAGERKVRKIQVVR